MKHAIQLTLLSSLGLLALSACGGSKQPEKTIDSTSRDEETSIAPSYWKASTVKTAGYIDGISESLDLKDFFAFEGQSSIDDVSFELSTNDFLTLSGHVLTSVGYGSTSIDPETERGNYSMKTILISVIRSSDVVNLFSDSIEGVAFSLDAKSDHTFALERGEGTMNDAKVEKATIKGTYRLNEDRFFVFTPDASSASFASEFMAELVYDQKDGSSFHLRILPPISSGTLYLAGGDLRVAK